MASREQQQRWLAQEQARRERRKFLSHGSLVTQILWGPLPSEAEKMAAEERRQAARARRRARETRNPCRNDQPHEPHRLRSRNGQLWQCLGVQEPPRPPTWNGLMGSA
jgi:hypothetical protein